MAAGELSTQRSHYDMVLERRSKKELEALLQEVLVDMRKRRSEGRLTA
ncbi:RNA polymerase-binding protein RbpA [Aquiluna sp.]|nr:RNA polymerase-binding protein RbpA [Aquiluna sp.]